MPTRISKLLGSRQMQIGGNHHLAWGPPTLAALRPSRLHRDHQHRGRVLLRDGTLQAPTPPPRPHSPAHPVMPATFRSRRTRFPRRWMWMIPALAHTTPHIFLLIQNATQKRASTSLAFLICQGTTRQRSLIQLLIGEAGCQRWRIVTQDCHSHMTRSSRRHQLQLRIPRLDRTLCLLHWRRPVRL